jgi:hypothetical protein
MVNTLLFQGYKHLYTYIYMLAMLWFLEEPDVEESTSLFWLNF